MNKSTFWAKFLLVDAIILVIGGFFFMLLPIIYPDGVTMFFNLYWSKTISLASEPKTYIGFLFGIYGTIMTVYGVTLVVLAYHLIKNSDEEFVWSAVTVGTVVWFVLETIVSIYTGAVPNLMGNVVFTALFLIPIIGRRFEADT